MTGETLQEIVGRLLAERPELWETFRVDPEGAIRDAGVVLTDAEWAELRRLTRVDTQALRRPESSRARDLAAKLRAELDQARAAQALDHNPLASELSAAAAEEPAPTPLDEERHQVESESDRLRAALAEEKKRVEAARRRMARAFGGDPGPEGG